MYDVKGRYYLSAETLSEMKNWVTSIRLVLEKNKIEAKEENSALQKEMSQDPPPNILEGSIHRSNSAATLYSTNQDQKG